MSTNEDSGNIVGAILVGIAAVLILGYIAVRKFSMSIGVPTEVGGDVLLRSAVAIVFTGFVGGWLLQAHPRRIVITMLVLLASLWCAFWPALDVWAAETSYSLSFADDPEVTMKWWGSTLARLGVLAAIAGAAAWLFVKND